MGKITIKTKQEIDSIIEGGKRLAQVKNSLFEAVKVGVSAWEIEQLAVALIKKSGAEASFSKVPKYHWATCININEGVVHGIPKKEVVFKKGDVVSVDVGLYYKGFHTDTSISVYLGSDPKLVEMMAVGKKALKMAINEAREGNKLVDISLAMAKALKAGNFNPVESLVGHGIGRALHEYPPIPCLVTGAASEDITIKSGFVFAIEVMYTAGDPELVTDSDGWTIRTQDGKMSGLFEETVAVTADGSLVLT